MERTRIFGSVVNSDIIKKIRKVSWCEDLVQYATVKCGIDGLLAASYLFCPEIIQVKDYIFIKQFLNCSEERAVTYINELEEQYHNKKDIEMSINSWSIGDFFVGGLGGFADNEELCLQFGKALVYFWKNRARDLFPERKIVVELGDELMGELGLCITMYEED